MPKKAVSHFWEQRRNIIRTRKGGWFIGKGVYSHGYSLMDDIVGKTSYFQSFILNVTGTLPKPGLAKWLESLWQCMSFPDARIWCNQIGALAGTMRSSPIAGITAGILASDSRMYGPGTIYAVYDFLTTTLEKKQAGMAMSAAVAACARKHNDHLVTPGYGRPLATGDERVIAMEAVACELAFESGQHLTFAYELEQYLLDTEARSINLVAYLLAFLLDQHWTLPQIQQLTAAFVMSGVAACYSEAFENPENSFLPLRCEDIDYQGPPPRPLPSKS